MRDAGPYVSVALGEDCRSVEVWLPAGDTTEAELKQLLNLD